MADVRADLVRDVTTTTGTGPITVSGTPPVGFWTFADVMSVGDTCTLAIRDPATGDREVGKWEYTDTDELTRVSTHRSSNGGAAVNWGSGNKDVFMTFGAADAKGSWVELDRQIASSDAAIDFVLPAGYDEYEIEMFGVVVDTASRYVVLRTSTDGGSSFDAGSTDYKDIVQQATAAGVAGATDNTSFLYLTYGFVEEDTPTIPIQGTITIRNPSAAVRCVITADVTYWVSALENLKMQGFRDAAANVDAVRITLNNTGNIASGTFILRGRRT